MHVTRTAKVVIILAVGAACVTPKDRTTWEEDELDGVAEHRSSRPWRAIDAAADSPRPKLKKEPLAAPKPHDLEAALLRFTALHQARMSKTRRQHNVDGWPPQLVGEWRMLLTDLQLGLQSQAVGANRRLLLQVRITLEAELERGLRRFGPPPTDLVRDTQVVFIRVQKHLAQGRPAPTKPRVAAADDIIWPVTPQILTSPFGYRRDPILGAHTYRFHAGIDLGGRTGTSVVAAAEGRVSEAGWAGGHGRSIQVRHPGGLTTVYSHLKRVLVREGQTVRQGETIGLMGSTGRSTGPHLHFEVRRGNVPVDPLELLLVSRRAHLEPERKAEIAAVRRRR